MKDDANRSNTNPKTPEIIIGNALEITFYSIRTISAIIAVG